MFVSMGADVLIKCEGRRPGSRTGRWHDAEAWHLRPVPLFDVVGSSIIIRGSFVGTLQEMAQALAFAVGELFPLRRAVMLQENRGCPRSVKTLHLRTCPEVSPPR